jgi:hypothetical protein
MNQRTGMFLGLAAAIIVAVLLVVFVFAGGDDDGDTTTTAGQDQPAGQTGNTGGTGGTGGQPAATGEFANLVNKFASQRSWRAQMTMEEPGQAPQSGTFEFVAPDKYRIVTSDPSLGSFEIISIGRDAYTKFGSMWTKQAGGGLGELFDVNSLAESIKELSGYTKGGMETVAGKRCQIYSRTQAGETEEFCIADDLPVRYVTSDSSGKTTIVFTDYNANIDIRAPI